MIGREALLSLARWSQTDDEPAGQPDSNSMEQPLSPSKESSHQCVGDTGAKPDDESVTSNGRRQ